LIDSRNQRHAGEHRPLRIVVAYDGPESEELLGQPIALAMRHSAPVTIVGGTKKPIPCAGGFADPGAHGFFAHRLAAAEVLRRAVDAMPKEVSVTHWRTEGSARAAVRSLPTMPGEIRLVARRLHRAPLSRLLRRAAGPR
jgi:hypothetical protein